MHHQGLDEITTDVIEYLRYIRIVRRITLRINLKFTRGFTSKICALNLVEIEQQKDARMRPVGEGVIKRLGGRHYLHHEVDVRDRAPLSRRSNIQYPVKGALKGPVKEPFRKPS